MSLLLHRVYERSKRSAEKNGKQRNLNIIATLNRMQVNLQFVGEKCLQDLDKVIEWWSNASPQRCDLSEVCFITRFHLLSARCGGGIGSG
jgi:hypothetical protein